MEVEVYSLKQEMGDTKAFMRSPTGPCLVSLPALFSAAFSQAESGTQKLPFSAARFCSWSLECEALKWDLESRREAGALLPQPEQ